MDSLDYKEFEGYFSALLEVFSKRDENGVLTGLYWKALTTGLEVTSAEFVFVMAQLISTPPDKFPSGDVIKGLIRQYRIDRLPKLPAKQGSQAVSINEFRQNRIAFLRGIYKHQGDTAFYRSMLAGNAGVFSKIAEQVLCGSGLTLEDLVVTHQDVTGISQAIEELTTDRPAAQPFQPDRRFMSNLAKQMLGEVE